MFLPKAGDTTTTRNQYIYEKHGINISVGKGVHQPAAMDKNLNTDCTEDTDLAFSLIFLVGKWLLDYYRDFLRFASACGTPFFLRSG